MRKLIASLILATLVTSPAYAWGDREQGALTGVAGLYILQSLGVVNSPRPPAVNVPAPVYPGYSHVPPPQSYTHRPMYRMVDIFIPECNCYRSVLVQIN